jgi:protein SCO1
MSMIQPACRAMHMKNLTATVLLVLLTPVLPVAAHSLEELQGQLGDREKYFQPVGKEAPEFTLEDATGRPVMLQDLRGKVVVLHFVYTSCPDVCPLHAERIAEIQEMVNRTPMRELVQFVTITTDPEHDTPEVMRNYGPAHGLDPANWTFLTSGPERPEDTTRQLAERFGHKFTEAEDGYQVHGVATHVIDREGRWQANFHGLEFEATNLVVHVNVLVNDVGAAHAHGLQSFWETLRGWF